MSAAPPGTEAAVRVSLFLKEPVALKPEELARLHRASTGQRLGVDVQADGAGGVQRVAVSDKMGALALWASPEPVPAETTASALELARGSAIVQDLAPGQVEALRGARGQIVLESRVNAANGRRNCGFSMLVLAELMEQFPGAVGYLVPSALVYRTREFLGRALRGGLQGSTPFLVFGNLHAVAQGGFWIHTHGMEHMGCPDVEVRFIDEAMRPYFMGLVGDTAMYMAAQGPVLQAGQTAELAGDGVVYRILPATEETGHGWGTFGALALERA